MPLSKHEAIKRLTRRYQEQALKYPTMERFVSLEQYIRANLRYVLRSWLGEDALAEYKNAS